MIHVAQAHEHEIATPTYTFPPHIVLYFPIVSTQRLIQIKYHITEENRGGTYRTYGIEYRGLMASPII